MTKQVKKEEPIKVTARGEMHAHDWTQVLPHARRTDGSIENYARKCQECGDVEIMHSPPEDKKH